MDLNIPALVCVGLIVVLFVVPSWIWIEWSERKVRKERDEAVAAGRHQPVTIQPFVDLATCMGSGACVSACPENVLKILEGQAVAVNMSACVGHGVCVPACPVDAIELVFGSEKRGIDIPAVGGNFETNVPGLFVAGELGGMGLIANAADQGAKAMGYAAEGIRKVPGRFDVAIVGAGPAGIAAGLAAKQRGLDYVVLEQETFGGAVIHYPRKKLVFTRPMDLPGYGKVKLSSLRKEELVGLFTQVVQKTGLEVAVQERVDGVNKLPDGGFKITTSKREVEAQRVVLALGRRGTPRKLGAAGEEADKVSYALLDPELYQYDHVLVVGGGDSAVEAAVTLGEQPGNKTYLSYRGAKINRPKKKNIERLRKAVKEGQVELLLESTVTEIGIDRVVIDQQGDQIVIPNDYVFVFVGGVLPTKFLQKAGVQIQKHFGKRVEAMDLDEVPIAPPAAESRQLAGPSGDETVPRADVPPEILGDDTTAPRRSEVPEATTAPRPLPKGDDLVPPPQLEPQEPQGPRGSLRQRPRAAPPRPRSDDPQTMPIPLVTGQAPPPRPSEEKTRTMRKPSEEKTRALPPAPVPASEEKTRALPPAPLPASEEKTRALPPAAEPDGLGQVVASRRRPVEQPRDAETIPLKDAQTLVLGRVPIPEDTDQVLPVEPPAHRAHELPPPRPDSGHEETRFVAGLQPPPPAPEPDSQDIPLPRRRPANVRETTDPLALAPPPPEARSADPVRARAEAPRPATSGHSRPDPLLLARERDDVGDDAQAMELYLQAARERLAAGSWSEALGITKRLGEVVERAARRMGEVEVARARRQAAQLQGEAHLGLGEWDRAVRPLEAAVVAARAEGSADALGHCLLLMGRACHRSGRFDAARNALEEALRTWSPEPSERASLLRLLADLSLRRGDLDDAEQQWNDALRAARELRSPEAEARAQRGQAHCMAIRGRLQESLDLLGQADEYLVPDGDLRVRAGVLARALELENAMGRYGASLYRVEILLELVTQHRLAELRPGAVALLSETLASVGFRDDAGDAATQAVALGRTLGSRGVEARIRAARTLCELDRFEDAEEALFELPEPVESLVDDPTGQLMAVRARIAAASDPRRGREIAAIALARPSPLLAIAAARIRLDASLALIAADQNSAARSAVKRGLKVIQGTGAKGLKLELLVAFHTAVPDHRVAEAAARTALRIRQDLPDHAKDAFLKREAIADVIRRWKRASASGT